MTEEEINKLTETAENNYQVMETVFNWLLENNLIEAQDIGEGETPEEAAKAFINIYKRLISKIDDFNEMQAENGGM
jgi:hypothetical protein